VLTKSFSCVAWSIKCCGAVYVAAKRGEASSEYAQRARTSSGLARSPTFGTVYLDRFCVSRRLVSATSAFSRPPARRLGQLELIGSAVASIIVGRFWKGEKPFLKIGALVHAADNIPGT
jgi:hypothetical protein